jgi:hypothetical protein
MIVAFIDELRPERIAAELTCAVLREQGCEVTARTYRVWRQPNRALAAGPAVHGPDGTATCRASPVLTPAPLRVGESVGGSAGCSAGSEEQAGAAASAVAPPL